MSPGRTKALAAGAGVIAVVLLVVGVMSGSSESRRLDRARHAETAERATLAATRDSIAEENRALRKAYVAAATLAKELVVANADVAFTRTDLETAVRALEQARSVLGSQSNRRQVIGQCLTGVRLALDATQRGDTSAATSFLRVAAPGCQSALTPPGAAAPVLAYDFADPFVMRVGNEYYAFATNAAGGSVQTAHSTDLTNWSLVGNALAAIPKWGVPGSVWAPATLSRGQTTVLYYTVRQASTGLGCISVAASLLPNGPFYDGSSKPLECGMHSAIDPSPFVDADGRPYLLFKTEKPARIWSRPLTADGRAFAGPARLMLESSQPWEGGSVEAPSLLRNGSSYWLFYSGNNWNSDKYAEGIARCAGPSGPCHAHDANPMLGSRDGIAGPGGGEVFLDAAGGWRLAYHAYQVPLVRYPNSRLLYFARIGFTPLGTPALSP